MTLILKQIFAFFKLLNSDKGTKSIALGFALGFILGMTPSFSLQTVLVILLLFFFRIQIGAALLAAFAFAFIAFLLDPLFHAVGDKVLSMDGLRPLFVSMYNMPIVPLTRFNNTIVMGSMVIALALAPVVYLLSKSLVERYRVTVVARFQETKFFKGFKATGFYKWYVKYDEYFG